MDFVVDYLPFWIVSYATAIVAWSCVGRFALELIIPPDTPNYILRWFQRLTNWPVQATKTITPRFFHTRFLPLICAYWCFVLRFAATTGLLYLDMVPRVTP